MSFPTFAPGKYQVTYKGEDLGVVENWRHSPVCIVTLLRLYFGETLENTPAVVEAVRQLAREGLVEAGERRPFYPTNRGIEFVKTICNLPLPMKPPPAWKWPVNRSQIIAQLMRPSQREGWVILKRDNCGFLTSCEWDWDASPRVYVTASEATEAAKNLPEAVGVISAAELNKPRSNPGEIWVDVVSIPSADAPPPRTHIGAIRKECKTTTAVQDEE